MPVLRLERVQLMAWVLMLFFWGCSIAAACNTAYTYGYDSGFRDGANEGKKIFDDIIRRRIRGKNIDAD